MSCLAATVKTRQLSAAELAELESKRDKLLRQLRIALRCVVAQLARDRRFAVFTRPVNPDEAPDYHEVIAQPMDLGAVRDRIDNGEYTSVRDFAKVSALFRFVLDSLSLFLPSNCSQLGNGNVA